jgi:hypothetical protein
MSKTRSMADLKAAYANKTPETNTNQGFSNNYYPFWNMKVGERAVVRFLPDANENNPRGFLEERLSHNLDINGQRRTIPCLTMYGEECPICKISQAFYKANDKINGKKYWKSKQHIGQVIVVEDPLLPNEETGEKHTGQLRYITLSYQIYNIIKEAFASDELESIPYDYENGYDFIIKKTEQGGYASYAVGTKFANKPRSLSETELQIVDEKLIELNTLLPRHPGTEKVQAMLDAEMNGEEYVDDSRPSTTPPASRPAKQVPPTAANEDEKPSTSAPVVDSTEEGSSDVEAMLASIKARRAAKQSA